MSRTVYRMLFRPPGFESLPSGLRWEYTAVPFSMAHLRPDLPTCQHPHGEFTTDRPLTEAELNSYQIEVVR